MCVWERDKELGHAANESEWEREGEREWEGVRLFVSECTRDILREWEIVSEWVSACKRGILREWERESKREIEREMWTFVKRL